MAQKEDFLLDRRLIDGIRLLEAKQFRAIICGLADIDEGKEPETKDPVALAFIRTQKRCPASNDAGADTERAANFIPKWAEQRWVGRT
jgi:hypothetical protein